MKSLNDLCTEKCVNTLVDIKLISTGSLKEIYNQIWAKRIEDIEKFDKHYIQIIDGFVIDNADLEIMYFNCFDSFELYDEFAKWNNYYYCVTFDIENFELYDLEWQLKIKHAEETKCVYSENKKITYRPVYDLRNIHDKYFLLSLHIKIDNTLYNDFGLIQGEVEDYNTKLKIKMWLDISTIRQLNAIIIYDISPSPLKLFKINNPYI